MVNRIYVPATSADDWQRYLAEPEKHWRTGYSARATAYSWQAANGFPEGIAALFGSSTIETLRGAKLLLAIPEHKVWFPPRQGHPSQNDVFALAKAADGALVSVAVEAKVSEPFGQTVGTWFSNPASGKRERLQFLLSLLALEGVEINHIHYQLLHRLASAIIEAGRFNAAFAVLIVHSFSQSDEWFSEFQVFTSLYGQSPSIGQLVSLYQSKDVEVLAGWARGDPKFLDA